MQFLAIGRQFNEPMMSSRADEQAWISALLSLVFLLVIAGLVVYAIRSASRQKADTNHQDPLDIAKERYAKGDITKEQFAEIKKELK